MGVLGRGGTPPPQGSPLFIEMRHPLKPCDNTMHTVAIHFIVALSVVSMCVTGEDCLDSVFDNSISYSLSISKTGPLIATGIYSSKSWIKFLTDY